MCVVCVNSYTKTTCGMIILQVSLVQVMELERSTKEQAKSKLWNIHREGCITASNFKAVVKPTLVFQLNV